jgi:hypothetical protein
MVDDDPQDQGGRGVKKVLLIIVVAALALTLVPLALAGAPGHGGWKHGKAKFNLVGRVAEPGADATLSTLTIKVKAGTRTVRELVRSEAPVTIAVDPEAKIRLFTDDGAVTIRLDAVPVGARVKARGTITRDKSGAAVFTIKDLKVHPLPVDDATPSLAQ